MGSGLLSALAKQPRENCLYPRIIQTQQIPWALTRPVPKPKVIDGPVIVVADATGQSRPSFAVIRTLPKLFTDPVPKGYLVSPFVQPPANIEALMKNREVTKSKTTVMELPDGPPDDGYCELCNCTFEDANAHRAGAEHSRRSANPDTFAVLDDLIATFNTSTL
jgi:hypothetical protein